MTPCLASGFSNLTARWSGVARSSRFCKSTSVSSRSSKSESASGEGVDALHHGENPVQVSGSASRRGEGECRRTCA